MFAKHERFPVLMDARCGEGNAKLSN